MRLCYLLVAALLMIAGHPRGSAPTRHGPVLVHGHHSAFGLADDSDDDSTSAPAPTEVMEAPIGDCVTGAVATLPPFRDGARLGPPPPAKLPRLGSPFLLFRPPRA